MKLLEKLKKDMIGEIYTKNQIDKIMYDNHYDYVDEHIDNIYKYTNERHQLWFYLDLDENEVMVTNIAYVTKEDGETKVDPFHCFEDYKMIQDWFWENKKYHHWLICALMAGIGRRVGDTVRIKWSHLVDSKGEFRKKLYLSEQKTGKTPAPIINDYVKQCVLKYCELKDIDLKAAYKTQREIFKVEPPAVRKAIKDAVEATKSIDYPVSCHSYRKFYANEQLKLHPNDPWGMRIIMEEMGHSSEEITRKYLNFFDDKKEKYQSDFANYMIEMEKGNYVEIDKSPTITLSSMNFVKLINEALKKDYTIENQTELLSMMEKMRVM